MDYRRIQAANRRQSCPACLHCRRITADWRRSRRRYRKRLHSLAEPRLYRIQPSEIMKIGIPMTVAWYFQRYEGRLKWIHYIVALVLILVPVALILKQPDLGTAALIMASVFCHLLCRIALKAIFAAIIAFVAALPLLWNYGMHDYQKTRVLTLLDPTKDPLGAGYHIINP